MIIIHFAEYAYGGVASYLRSTIQSQCSNDKVNKVILFCSDEKSESFDFSSNKFVNVRYHYRRNLNGIFKMLTVAKKAISMKPDIIHFHSTFAGLCRLLIPLKRGYAVFYSSHGWSFLRQTDGELKHVIYALIERALSIKTDKIINISKFEQKAALKRRLPKGKMIVIYNSILPTVTIDKNIPSPFKNESTLKIGFIGRLDSPKGFPFLIKALNRMDLSWELMVIGESVVDDDEPYKAVDESKIHFLGWIDHQYIDSYFAFLDFLIVPSRWEGFGLVALESMKNSKPVLASDAGGLPEIVKDGVNGYIFQKMSSESFERQFKKMKDSDLKKLGANGRRIMVDKFNYSYLQELLFKAYETELGEKNGVKG
ncbi:glycosyltransferase [Lactiplantibacillus daoliensis]|uniref:Glycosyltransferase n=1 Tax=Lactiplantibacillus daoliensis TaxID=2559916 RepID=A0ABW1UDH5_9LACO|nr:glycosyltransferase [Lactiplantibacillus daoliensis]